MVNKYNFLCRKGSKFNQIICAIMINLSSMSYGAALGWMSPMTLLLQSPESPRGDPLTDQEVSWMASASYLTSIPSNFFFAYIADRWGRKKSLMFCSAQFLCCWLVKLSSTSTWALVVARALVGTGMGGAYVIIPLYVKEISEDSIRGTLGSLMILSQTIGTLLLYIFGDMFGYRTILLICLTIPAVHITFFLLMPESPAFLVKQGDAIEATRALSWLRCSHDGDSAIQLELDMLKKELEREQDNNKCSLKAILNLPVFSYGTSIGWMSPMTLLLQSENSPKGEPLSDIVVSWMAAVAYLMCVPLDFVIAYLSDKHGRKPTLLMISVSCVALWSVKLASMDTWAFILARAMVGVSMAGCYVTCPLYTKEISEDSIRGLLGSFVILFHTFGNLFTYIIGDILSYHMVLWICLTIPTVHIALFLMMPESPSFLVKAGKYEEAAKVIGWLRCRSEDDIVVQRELDLIKKELQNDEEKSKFLLKDICKSCEWTGRRYTIQIGKHVADKIFFRAFRIAIIVSLAREVCGAIPVLNFAGEIFSLSSEGTGLVLSPNQQAMMLGAVQVIGSGLASSIVEKAGRKPLLFTTSLLSGVSMCVLASWFLAKDYGVAAPSWIPVTTLCLCIFCDSSGMCPISVVIISEIFSFKYRGAVMAISMATAGTTDIFQVLFFKPLVNSVGIHAAFYFFGIVCFLNAAYVLIVIPETKKKSLEEIYYKLKTKREIEEEIKPIKEVDA